MNVDVLSPDQVAVGPWLNLTIVSTWIVMALLMILSWLATRNLSSGPTLSRWQHFLEIIVATINQQIRDISRREPDRYLPFIGTLFLFIALSNALAIVPGFTPPTASLSTTTALAICVFVAVPIYGIASQGLAGYLAMYLRPTPLMLPFNLMGELTRTLALAVRLFGNMMSGMKIAAILLAVTPLFFPVVMNALGLLMGLIQAYIFAILAIVYIASATQAHSQRQEQPAEEKTN